MAEGKFSWKFYLGIFLIVASLIIGKIDLVVFALYLNNPAMRWAVIISYIISWTMLLIGIWLAGREYYNAVKKYVDYKFYHESLKKGTRKAYDFTKEKTNDMRKRTMDRTREFGNKLKKNRGEDKNH